jgi:hypothetical protein
LRAKEDRENKARPDSGHRKARGRASEHHHPDTADSEVKPHATRELQNPRKGTKQAAEARTGKEIERSATIEALPPHSSVTAERRTSEAATQRRVAGSREDAKQWAVTMWQSVIEQQHGLFGVWHSTNRARSTGTEKASRGALNKIWAREAGSATDSNDRDYERAWRWSRSQQATQRPTQRRAKVTAELEGLRVKPRTTTNNDDAKRSGGTEGRGGGQELLSRANHIQRAGTTVLRDRLPRPRP